MTTFHFTQTRFYYLQVMFRDRNYVKVFDHQDGCTWECVSSWQAADDVFNANKCYLTATQLRPNIFFPTQLPSLPSHRSCRLSGLSITDVLQGLPMISAGDNIYIMFAPHPTLSKFMAPRMENDLDKNFYFAPWDTLSFHWFNMAIYFLSQCIFVI